MIVEGVLALLLPLVVAVIFMIVVYYVILFFEAGIRIVWESLLGWFS